MYNPYYNQNIYNTPYQDGQLVPGAMQTVTAAADGIINFSLTVPVRVFCGQSESVLTIYSRGQNVNTMNVAIEVVKE